MTSPPSGTVTFLFSDIEGSTKLAREHSESWETLRSRHHQILQEAIESNHGFIFQVIGDAFCAAFHTAGEALKAAVKAQQGLQSEPWGECVIRVRMGIHTGAAEAQDGEYRGYLTLSLVQRLMSAGHGGQLLISGATENLLRGQLPKDISLRDIGKHNFKDVPQPVRVFQVIALNLPTEFPPLRTIDSHPNNLPTQLTSFVGRGKELADVKKLLHDAHLLTLIGPGGTGKTRLSIQAAGELLDQYPDGVWLVELAPILDPLLVPRTTAIAIGLRDEPQRPVIDMLCDYLRGKNMLLMLDNCEHLVNACAQMTNRILQAAPNVRILASSREALGIAGEVTYRVPSLGLPDVNVLPSVEALSQYEAVRLFIDRAISAIPSFVVTNENAPAVAQICHRLDGIPLAIELAAAKVRVLRVDQIAKRLDDRFRLLTGGSRTALERHQTLRAAIDWSYNLLPPTEQVLFRRLSVFVGGWTLETAESVCSDGLVEREDVLNLLEQLINKSLVIMDETQIETRYSLLETLRQYANEKLVDSAESDQLRDAHMEYFLNLAETAEPHLIRSEQLEWLARLDADHENLRLALEWTLSKESAEFSLRLCAALGRFWSMRFYWLEGAKWLFGALAKPEHNQNETEKVARVGALCQDARFAGLLDDLERMKSSAELGFKLAQEVGDRHYLAIATFLKGLVFIRYTEMDRARPYVEQSLREFQELRDLYWESYASRWLCIVQFNQGQPEVMENMLHTIGVARRAGERWNLARTLILYADLLFVHDQINEASNHLRQAVELSKQISSTSFVLVLTQMSFARIEWFRGNHGQARTLYTEAQARLDLLGERYTGTGCSISLGLLSMQAGEFDQAQTYFEEALLTAQEMELKVYVLFCLAWLGVLFSRQGNREKSKHRLEESMRLVRGLPPSFQIEWLGALLGSPYFQRSEIAGLLQGATSSLRKNYHYPADPLFKRYCARGEAEAKKYLGETAYERAFSAGERLSLDEAIDWAQKAIEEL